MIGIMIPQGNLSDEQIANVLTFVRNNWGNTGGAVTPDEVRNERNAMHQRWRQNQIRLNENEWNNATDFDFCTGLAFRRIAADVRTKLVFKRRAEISRHGFDSNGRLSSVVQIQNGRGGSSRQSFLSRRGAGLERRFIWNLSERIHAGNARR